jgi:DNA-binding transcriptional LysR family regulator
VAIAEERNFTRAAERCFVVQSALSHQIKALEQELGTALFVRTSRRVELTGAGEAFLVEARASLAAADRAIAAAAEATGQIRGSLSIGVIPTVTAINVPNVIETFHDSYPQVDLTVRSGGSDTFIREIREGRLDVAFLGLDAATATLNGVASHEMARERLVVVMSTCHELARDDTVTLADLAEETFIDFPTGTPGRLQSDRAFDTAGLLRRVAFEAMSVEFMLALVQRKLGLCLLPAGTVPHDPRVRAIPVTDGPVRTEFLAWNDFNPSPPARAFVEQAKKSINVPSQYI